MKDTLHDTVGTAFQRRSEDPSFSTEEARTYIPSKRKQKPTYDPIGIQVKPYQKNPKRLPGFSTAEEIKKSEESVNLLLIESRN